jgi:hypothetical protein
MTADSIVHTETHVADCRDVYCGWTARGESEWPLDGLAIEHNVETGHGVEVTHTRKAWHPPQSYQVPYSTEVS